MNSNSESTAAVTPWLHLVLHQPEIPGNTGAVGRTCVALGAKLWLVRPLGFRIDEKTLRRAGLDYWQHLNWEVVNSWEDLLAALGTKNSSASGSDSREDRAFQPPMGTQRIWYLSKSAEKSIYDVSFSTGDVMVFGSETNGLPPSFLSLHPDTALRIPISASVRSLNLSNAVAVCGYEAHRQIFESPRSPT